MSRPLGLFQGYGVELEYMLVAGDRLEIQPVADRVLRDMAGAYVNEHAEGEVSWSNELVLHVLELKNTDPTPALEPLAGTFQDQVGRMNRRLEATGARLMPSGMHPFMDPRRETRLWPHEGSEIYRTFDRLFDCRRHGWANLQSAQLNLSFADDAEFLRLHSAIRILLPILPAVSASSPFQEGRRTGMLDTRLEAYRLNATTVPIITGRVIPEALSSRSEYESRIYEPIQQALDSLDPGGPLHPNWVNARGAIARFDRMAIEIRILDMQECPAADLAIAEGVASVLKALAGERWADLERQQSCSVDSLEALLLECLRDAEETVIENRGYLDLFGFPSGPSRATARDLWHHLLEQTAPASWAAERLARILERGTLARRILRAVGGNDTRERIASVYRELCDCLAAGESFGDR